MMPLDCCVVDQIPSVLPQIIADALERRSMTIPGTRSLSVSVLRVRNTRVQPAVRLGPKPTASIVPALGFVHAGVHGRWVGLRLLADLPWKQVIAILPSVVRSVLWGSCFEVVNCNDRM